MARWGFWDWTAYLCLGIAALGLAAGAALKEEPGMLDRLPTFFTGPKWAYVPMILFALGSAILAVRFAGPLLMGTPVTSSDSSERVFVEETPEYLMGLASGLTAVQFKQATAIYINKWLKVSGPVANVSEGVAGDTMFVTVNTGNSDMIRMYFKRRWWDRLALHRVGQSFSAIGQINQINRLDIVLENCELTSATPQSNSEAEGGSLN